LRKRNNRSIGSQKVRRTDIFKITLKTKFQLSVNKGLKKWKISYQNSARTLMRLMTITKLISKGNRSPRTLWIYSEKS